MAERWPSPSIATARRSAAIRFPSSSDGANRVVTVAIDLAVKAMGITAYRYIHDGQEVWNGDTLQALDSQTDDNGKKYTVHVQRGAKGLIVDREASPMPFNASPPPTRACSRRDRP